MAYLVTGAQGCIGSWVVKNLLEAGESVVVFDIDRQPKRLLQILSVEQITAIHFVAGDICHPDAIQQVFEAFPITHVIHLAALQVPACQANPQRGGLVNVVGTLNIFEAAGAHAGQVQKVVYASSAAVAGPPEEYGEAVFTEASSLHPSTHYGVFKQCNEGNARVYFAMRGISSIGLRPWAVYGVGRDFGITSDPTKAIKSAVLGRPYQLQFGGRADMQYADDVAKIFHRCAAARLTGAHVFNLRGTVLEVRDMVATIERELPRARGLLTHRDNQLPIVPDFDDRALRAAIGELPQRSFAEGVRETIAIFEQLHRENRLPIEELG